MKSTLGLMSALVGLLVAPINANAQPNQNAQGTFGNLIAALNNVAVQTGDIDIVVADLRGADINVLNNLLNKNNIELFTGAESDLVDIEQLLTGIEILNELQVQDVLNDLTVILNDVVNVNDVVIGVNVLTGQVFVLLP